MKNKTTPVVAACDTNYRVILSKSPAAIYKTDKTAVIAHLFPSNQLKFSDLSRQVSNPEIRTDSMPFTSAARITQIPPTPSHLVVLQARSLTGAALRPSAADDGCFRHRLDMCNTWTLHARTISRFSPSPGHPTSHLHLKGNTRSISALRLAQVPYCPIIAPNKSNSRHTSSHPTPCMKEMGTVPCNDKLCVQLLVAR